jgi:hypothetical protein
MPLELERRRNQHPPSPPLYGAVIALTVIASALIVLTYTLLPLPGQRELGGWNYVGAVLCLAMTAVLTKRFRPAHFLEEDLSVRPRVKQGRSAVH